jgi:hypothetical protein
LPDRLAPKEERDEEEQTAARDTRHGPVRGSVARFLDPGVCVEGEEEAEAGCES